MASLGFHSLVFCFCIALHLQVCEAKTWALLVAGSNTYDNYRHQSDICHAYHILKNHGIPAENIVTMMFDDIAYNEENPYQGNIINQPDGPNVYTGVKIDYNGSDITPSVFLAVLQGNKKAVEKLTGKSGRVIESTKDDRIFVNFADHGGPGLLCFPEDVLHASTLERTLKKMYKKKQYKDMVLYIEACESGSIFSNKLSSNLNIYAVTAANESEPSWPCYYDDARNTFLGDVFSVNWMQDSDKENLQVETLGKQVGIVTNETNKSHVSVFGDLSIEKLPVGDFQGMKKAPPAFPSPRHPSLDAVPAGEVQMKILQSKLRKAVTPADEAKASKAILDLKTHYTKIDQFFSDIVNWVNKIQSLRAGEENKGDVLKFKPGSLLSHQSLLAEDRPITQWACYEEAVNTLTSNCDNMRITQSYYALKQLKVLVNLCERGIPDYDIRLAVFSTSDKHPNLCKKD